MYGVGTGATPSAPVVAVPATAAYGTPVATTAGPSGAHGPGAARCAATTAGRSAGPAGAMGASPSTT